VVEDLLADLAGGSGDDDHENHLQERDRMILGLPNRVITIAFTQIILSRVLPALNGSSERPT
jgi:hypothetical protein